MSATLSEHERREAREGLVTAGSLVGPATIFVAAGLLVPIAILFRYSLNELGPYKQMVEALSVANYVRFFSDPYYTAVLARTLRVALTCMLACLLLGFPLAYVLARTQSRRKNWLVMLVVLPLFVGNAVRAAGWMALFGSKGVVNSSLMQIGLIDAPLEIMYTEVAVTIGIIAVNLPFMVLTLQSVIEGIDRAVEEAAFSLGANPYHMARRVLLPLALPGVLAGSILTFILAMNESGFSPDAFVAREVGYTIADVLAKCLFGLLIFSIARIKSSEDDPEFAKKEFREEKEKIEA